MNDVSFPDCSELNSTPLVQNISLKWDCEEQSGRKYGYNAEFRVKGILSVRVEEGQCLSSCVALWCTFNQQNGTDP